MSKVREFYNETKWIALFAYHFFHPDYTVGYGVSPYHVSIEILAGSHCKNAYSRWGITPRPEVVS